MIVTSIPFLVIGLMSLFESGQSTKIQRDFILAWLLSEIVLVIHPL
jgi:hypothetical protein